MPTRHFHQKLLKVLRCYSRHLTIYILNHYTKYMRLKYFQLGSKHRIIKKKCNVSLQCRLFFLFFSYFIFFKMKNVQIFKKQTSLFSISTPFKFTPIPSLCYFSIYEDYYIYKRRFHSFKKLQQSLFEYISVVYFKYSIRFSVIPHLCGTNYQV